MNCSISLFDIIPASVILALSDQEASCLIKAVALYESSSVALVIPNDYPMASAFLKEYISKVSMIRKNKKTLSEKRAEAGRRGGVAKASKILAKASKSSNCQNSQDLPKQELISNEIQNFATQKNGSESDFATSRAHVIKNQEIFNNYNNTIPKEEKKEKESDDSPKKENQERSQNLFGEEWQKKTMRVDTAMVKKLWNEIVVSLRPIRDIKDQRLISLQARIREEGWTSEELPERLRELFQRVQDSEFLSGRNGKWTRCSIDKVVESRIWNNILEGKYDNENNQPSATPVRTSFHQQGDKPKITEKILNDGDYKQPDGSGTGARIELRQFEFEEDGRTIPYHPRPFKVIKIKTSSSH